MIYRNGKKIGAIFRNGKAESQIFRNGKLVWQKAKPEAKRVKSITVSVPAWGTVERIEWESIFRAVPEDISNYYLDVTLKGVGVRLRGSGGRYKSIIEKVPTVPKIEIVVPDNLFLTTDDVYVGQALTFSAKVPTVTSEPSQKSSNSAYKKDAHYLFENAPFFSGSTLSVIIRTTLAISGGAKGYTLKANLNGVFVDEAPAVTSEGKYKDELSVTYEADDYKSMATSGTDFYMSLTPTFSLKLSSQAIIGTATLTSPACSFVRSYKITSIETI